MDIHNSLWNVITQPCLNIRCGLANVPLKLGHWGIIASHCFVWIWLLIHGLILTLLISVGKRGTSTDSQKERQAMKNLGVRHNHGRVPAIYHPFHAPIKIIPECKFHRAHLGPTGPRWAHGGSMNLAIWTRPWKTFSLFISKRNLCVKREML